MKLKNVVQVQNHFVKFSLKSKFLKGARIGSITWYDNKNKQFWLFGGQMSKIGINFQLEKINLNFQLDYRL